MTEQNPKCSNGSAAFAKSHRCGERLGSGEIPSQYQQFRID